MAALSYEDGSAHDDTFFSAPSSALPELVVEPVMPSAAAPASAPAAPPESPLYYADHTPKVIAMRPMGVDDIDQVRELHEQWFPIKYQQSFYDGAAQGVWRETGFPLFTRLAAEEAQPRFSVVTSPAANDDAAAAFGFQEWSPRPATIYGAVMASTIPLTSIEDHGLLAPDDYIHTHAMYILTLGSRAAVRRRGVASALLAECVEAARRQPQCGAVYLHVKADNLSALRFYEKNGFRNLRYLEDYYVIDGVRHSAYLYILYVNGAEPQSGWLELLTKPFFAFFSMASQGLKKLLDGMLDETASPTDKSAQRGRRKAQPATAPPLVDDMHVSHVPAPPSNAAVVSCV